MSRNRRATVRVFVAAVWLAVATLGGIFPPLASRAVAGIPDEADRVFFVFAVDAIGGFYPDRGTMMDALGSALKEQGLDARASIRVFEAQKNGNQWNTSNDVTDWSVLNYLRGLRPNPNDSIVFYYTGHGGFYPEKGHILCLRRWENGKKISTDLYRKDVLAAMARYPHRASIVLTDCCASGVAATVSDPRAPGKDQAPDGTVESLLSRRGHGEVVRDLFFRSRGTVNITSSRTGTTSGSRGLPAAEGGGLSSHFTVALGGLLKADRGAFHAGQDRPVVWEEFFPQLERLTEVVSYKYQKPYHDPESFLIGQARSSVGPPPAKNPVLTVDGELTGQDMVLNQPIQGQKQGGVGFYHHLHPVQMARGNAYLINLHSFAFDTFVYVLDHERKSVLAWNDDAEYSTTLSRILFFPPADGLYYVGATSFNPGETGKFSLRVDESTFSNRLAPSDPLDRFCAGSYAKVHPVELAAFRTYTIRLISENTSVLDPYLRVEDEFGDTVALNDDEIFPTNLNSMVTFRTQAAGTYYLIATSFEQRKIGQYAIFVQK